MGLGDWVLPASSVSQMFLEYLHTEDPLTVVVQTEVDQPSEVDGGDAQRETELVSLHTSESDSPMVVGHQPCDRSFHHRTPSSVVLGEVALPPCATRLDQLCVVRVQVKGPAGLRGGAAFSE